MQNIRPAEGEIVQYYDKHTSAVSVIKLSADERHAVSGSWDKSVVEWDLDTGKAVRTFDGCYSQVSSIEWQPVGGALVQHSASSRSGNGGDGDKISGDGSGAAADDDDEKSLDSLFGDDDEDAANGTAKQDDDDDLFSEKQNSKSPSQQQQQDDDSQDKSSAAATAGTDEPASAAPTTNQISHSVFLTSCIDGTVDVWDRRSATRAAHVGVSSGTPPWAMSVSFILFFFFRVFC